MAGHSKWNNIKRVKSVVDAKRGALFSRIAKDLTIATELGGSGDPKMNPYLRIPVDKARSANMPQEKIEKAINKGLGIGSDDVLLEKTYEVSAFGGVILLIDCETENSNRTSGEIRNIVNKSNAKMVPEGALNWNYKEFGSIKIMVKHNIEETSLNLMSLDNVEDVLIDGNEIQIITKRESLREVAKNIKESFNDYEFLSAELIKEPVERVNLSDDLLSINLDLIDKLKNHQDVVYVWDNISN